MAKQADEIQRRPFTQDEHRAMINAGILSRNERSVLRDGQIFVRPMDARRYWPISDDPGPTAGEVPADAVVMERPSAIDQIEEVLTQMNTPTTDAFVPRRFNVEEYYAMAEAGILAPDERVELLAGEVIVMAAIGSKHAFCVDSFVIKLAPLALNERAWIRGQNPVLLGADTQLQPDIAVVRQTSYADAHPASEDVLLLIEVADTTVGADRHHKLPTYARFGIPETWLADLNAHRVEVHTEPVDGTYSRVEHVGMDETLAPAAFPDVVIHVKDVMPA